MKKCRIMNVAAAASHADATPELVIVAIINLHIPQDAECFILLKLEQHIVTKEIYQIY